MQRHDVEFTADEETVRGWLFSPDRPGPWPTVVIGEGLGGIKEMSLDRIGRTFAASGLAVVAFDYLNFGESGGTHRQLVDPEQQVRTFRAAIDFAAAHSDIDGTRIGAWGASFGGAHVLRLATTDAPIACAVSVVPHVGIPFREVVLQAIKPRTWATMLRSTVPLVSPTTQTPALLQDRAGYEYLVENFRHTLPRFRNEISTKSMPKVGSYTPVSGPASTPIRIVIANGDVLNPGDKVRAAITTSDHVEFVEIVGGHFDIYGSSYQSMTEVSLQWLTRHLLQS